MIKELYVYNKITNDLLFSTKIDSDLIGEIVLKNDIDFSLIIPGFNLIEETADGIKINSNRIKTLECL